MDTMQKVAVPLAIVLAGALIAAALYFSGRGAAPAVVNDTMPQPTTNAKIADVQPDDHIRGNPNAELVIVEFSDTECPFCKNFHLTLKQLLAEYGADGRVAWVYRHFPLTQLHPQAAKEAEALECAAELGGNDGFWKYTDKLYEITPSNNGLQLSMLPTIAEQVGLDKAAFTECLDSGRQKKAVDEDLAEAIASGGQGTPHSIVIYGGEQLPLSGAQPYEVVKVMIDTLLEQ